MRFSYILPNSKSIIFSTNSCVHTHTRAHARICVRVCVCKCVCARARVCVCVYIFSIKRTKVNNSKDCLTSYIWKNHHCSSGQLSFILSFNVASATISHQRGSTTFLPKAICLFAVQSVFKRQLASLKRVILQFYKMIQ